MVSNLFQLTSHQDVKVSQKQFHSVVCNQHHQKSENLRQKRERLIASINLLKQKPKQQEKNKLEGLFGLPMEFFEEEKKTVNENSIPVIPCDICGKDISFNEYDNHSESHKKEAKMTEEEQANTAIIHCEICGKEVVFKDYKAHIKEQHPSNDKIPEEEEEEKAENVEVKKEGRNNYYIFQNHD